MNYKVLYRKYRPNDFQKIVGQEYIIKILKNSITNNKLSHAYIFAGPRGTGKTTTAKVFAKSVNCLNNVDGNPCGTCINCQNFNDNSDICEIDAASNNGVDQIREITNNIKLAPNSSKYRIYIIDEVHMLSTSAFNALLLTLEEPPAHVIFILATTNVENVPITVLSRCQRFDFKKISNDTIEKYLKTICTEENILIDDDAIKEIAYVADGAMRDALSLLDQVSKENTKITLDLVDKELGTVSIKKISEILDALEDFDPKRIIHIIDEFRKSSFDYKLIIKKIIDLCSIRAKEIVINNIAKNITYSEYKSLVIELADILNKSNINVDSYALIELVLLSYVKNKEMAVKETDIVVKPLPPKETNLPQKTIDLDILLKYVHNCFVNASKELKQEMLPKWSNFKEKCVDSNIKWLIEDTIPVLVSSEIAIFTTDLDKIVYELNEKNSKIEESFYQINKNRCKLIFVNNETWKNEKNKYILDKKQGLTYEIIQIKETKEDELEKIATELFSSDKIETK